MSDRLSQTLVHTTSTKFVTPLTKALRVKHLHTGAGLSSLNGVELERANTKCNVYPFYCFYRTFHTYNQELADMQKVVLPLSNTFLALPHTAAPPGKVAKRLATTGILLLLFI